VAKSHKAQVSDFLIVLLKAITLVLFCRWQACWGHPCLWAGDASAGSACRWWPGKG